MSKKKKRYTKKSKRYYHRKHNVNHQINSAAKDRHHILFQKRQWVKPYAKLLRYYWWNIILIPKNTLHKELHQHVWCVPVPKEDICLDALRQLQELDSYGVLHEEDNIIKRLEILISIFELVAQPTADALKQQLEVAKLYAAKSYQNKNPT